MLLEGALGEAWGSPQELGAHPWLRLGGHSSPHAAAARIQQLLAAQQARAISAAMKTRGETNENSSVQQ